MNQGRRGVEQRRSCLALEREAPADQGRRRAAAPVAQDRAEPAVARRRGASGQEILERDRRAPQAIAEHVRPPLRKEYEVAPHQRDRLRPSVEI